MMRIRKTHIAWAILALVICAGVIYLVREYAASQLSPEAIREWVRSFGVLAPVAFVLLLGFAPLVFIPGTLLTAAAGLVFGWQTGIWIVMLGNNICANVGFWIARLLGRDRVHRLAKGHLHRVEDQLGHADFRTILSLRLMPIAPFQLINYGSGISRVKWRDYFFATLIGTIPGTFFYTYIGSHLHWEHPQLWFALGCLFLLSSMPYVRKWFQMRRSGVKLRPHWTWGLVIAAFVLWGIGGFMWART